MSEGFHFELLPIEVDAAHLQALFRSQFKKGISLDQVISAIEKDTLQKVRKNMASQGKRSIEETSKWLDILIAVRKEKGDLSPEERNEVERIENVLKDLHKELDSHIEAIIQERMAACRDLSRVLKKAIEEMERKTLVRTKKIVLEYEKMGQEKFDKIETTFDQFFTQLKHDAGRIIAFLEPKLAEFNRRALSTGRGFLLESPDLPCSILFSVRGRFWLLFKKVGHLLGTGVDKRVFRAICLPEGTIQAVIEPFFFQEMAPQGISEAEVKKKQFRDMWTETQMLVKLKGKRGIVELEERMAIEMSGEKKLFLVEDYYWDGTLKDYLKYPIHLHLAESRLTPQAQRKVLSDLLEGLVEIHKHNIVHHDIKADNILLDQERVKVAIADFHLATYAQDRKRIGELKFLPKWAPPEHAKNHLSDRPMEEKIKEEIALTTGKMDIWSMGLIFYSLIAYELPFWFDKEGTIDVIFPILAGLKRGWLPEGLKNSPYYPLLEKMLEPDPNDRCTAEEALARI